MSATVGEFDVLTGELEMAVSGAWKARFDLDADDVPKGATIIAYAGEGTPESFFGTIVESAPDAGRTSVRIIGGAAGLKTTLPAVQYDPQTPASTVIKDIAIAAGERIAAGVQEATQGIYIADPWMRTKGTGERALDLLLAKINALQPPGGWNWRILANGCLWVGKETWPQATVPFQTKGASASGVAKFAPDSPTLRPGTNLGGKRVCAVTHRFGGGLRTEAVLAEATDNTPTTNRRQDAEKAFVRAAVPELQELAQYEARVVSQNEDGTLEVVCDDERVGDLSRVPIWLGLPGCSVEVAAGARVKVAFDAAKPEGRFASVWKTDAEALLITIRGVEVHLGEGAGRVIREGDLIMFPVGVAATPTPMPVTYSPSVVVAGPPGAGYSVVKA